MAAKPGEIGKKVAGDVKRDAENGGHARRASQVMPATMRNGATGSKRSSLPTPVRKPGGKDVTDQQASKTVPMKRRTAGGLGYLTADQKRAAERKEGLEHACEISPISFQIYLQTRKKDPKNPVTREIWDPKNPGKIVINEEFNGSILTNARKISGFWERFITGIPNGSSVRTIYFYQNGKELHHSGVTISLDDVEICVRYFTSRMTGLNKDSNTSIVEIPKTQAGREDYIRTLEVLNDRAKQSKRRKYFLIFGTLGAALVPGGIAYVATKVSAGLAAALSGSISVFGAYSMGSSCMRQCANAGGISCVTNQCTCCITSEEADEEELGIDIEVLYGEHLLYNAKPGVDLRHHKNFTGVVLQPLPNSNHHGAIYNKYKIFMYEKGKEHIYSGETISVQDFEVPLIQFIVDPAKRDENGLVTKPSRKEKEEFRFYCMTMEKLHAKARFAKQERYGTKGMIGGVGLFGSSAGYNMANSLGEVSYVPVISPILNPIADKTPWVGAAWVGYKAGGKLGNAISDAGGFTGLATDCRNALTDCSFSVCCEQKPIVDDTQGCCGLNNCDCSDGCKEGVVPAIKSCCSVVSSCFKTVLCDAPKACLSALCCGVVKPCFKGIYNCFAKGMNKIGSACQSNAVAPIDAGNPGNAQGNAVQVATPLEAIVIDQTSPRNQTRRVGAAGAAGSAGAARGSILTLSVGAQQAANGLPGAQSVQSSHSSSRVSLTSSGDTNADADTNMSLASGDSHGKLERKRNSPSRS